MRAKAILKLEKIRDDLFPTMPLDECLGQLIADDHETVGDLYHDGIISRYCADLWDVFIEEVWEWFRGYKPEPPAKPNLKGWEMIDAYRLI